MFYISVFRLIFIHVLYHRDNTSVFTLFFILVFFVRLIFFHDLSNIFASRKRYGLYINNMVQKN